ncbi:ABC transporter substrate-binding protein [Alicyclobacillus cycloheptanicus]|uniref:Peptide/nickel transport system substrate-binding protein n=1 Tax=Alicyclobacillus cycloheptanicus TaxID=1457 RepID=A0ABT9XFG7_9BACL|nr:ABC transporter substrate-binding protein [Alicyclobacillus cycloheptanicus]MDQ0189043.1 peptide/nickel transport system substrate-binding protein [Alicyclobacillus cycloheptanicus]WDM00180.1 ABC transporter substrate-binding protein [Alicyclobacillus cycloheptanicus]
MKRKRITITLASMAIGLSAVLAGCSNQAPGSSNAGGNSSGSGAAAAGVIKVGLDVDAENLDPRLSTNTTDQRVEDLVYEGLVRLDSKLNPEPDLATSWSNPNPTTWIFHLRQGVKFQDGTPLTAEDVKYTYESEINPSTKAPYASLYQPIKTIKILNNSTIEFDLSEPYAPLLSYMTLGIVPEHIATKSGDPLQTHPVGTGPYKFVSWTKNSKIVLQANSNYWAGAPKTNEIDYDIIPDNSTRAAALESGGVDLVQSPLSPQDVTRIEKESQYVVDQTTGLGFDYLNFNFKNQFLKDPKVREAIASLIDKQSITSSIYQGLDTPGVSVLLPNSWAYTSSTPQYNYDPAKAKQLLESDGWTLGSDGVFEKNGQKLTITLSTHSEDPNRVQTVQYLQNVLQQNGIQTKVSIAPWATFQSNLIAGKYDIALLGWLNLVDPDRAMYTQFYTGGTNNWGSYSNPQVDKLLSEGRAVQQQTQRAAIYQQAAALINKDVAYDVIGYQKYVVMYTKNLTGFQYNPSGSLYGLWKAELK